ncbi:hypothetical protein J2Y69_002490 [Microbacterium resistens]|uniref:Uncharacterized protein n=1 Tax=Microbacterium resistens TaxID=156977 RepID=A0ABU1SE44_9MICO|nr:hypothetical protein [Microbacterium resistens]MDR6867882.1 hypothetical protein [Microbacterium resistens]
MATIFIRAVEEYRLLRDEYEVVLIAAYERAVEATRGAMVNRRGRAAGISDWDLFTHNGSYARAYASEELIEHWAQYPRPTFSAFERQMVA